MALAALSHLSCALVMLGCGGPPSETTTIGRIRQIEAGQPVSPPKAPQVEYLEPAAGATFGPSAEVTCRVKLTPQPGETLPFSVVFQVVEGDLILNAALGKPRERGADGSAIVEGKLQLPARAGSYAIRPDAVWFTVVEDKTSPEAEPKRSTDHKLLPSIEVRVQGT
jgi:hypothetical protein